MQVSDTSICNLALANLGVSSQIANINTEKSVEARSCRIFYELTLKNILRKFIWPFATKIDTLALVQQNPNLEWQYSYRKPNDCLFFRRILSGTRNDTNQTKVPYKIMSDTQGELIFTDKENAQAEWTVFINDPNKFASDFIISFSYLLALRIRPMISNSQKTSQEIMVLYNDSILNAGVTAANEEMKDEEPDSEFITIRN